MYDSKKAAIDATRLRFDEEVAARLPSARNTGADYLELLTDFINTFEAGAGGDPNLRALDTTGELDRLDDTTAWAETERHRVRKTLSESL